MNYSSVGYTKMCNKRHAKMTAFKHVLKRFDRSSCTVGDITVMNGHWECVYYHRNSEIE